MAKQPPITATCTCSHAGMWHTGTRCKILDCECTEFKHSVARRADGTWVEHEQPGSGKRMPRGKGPNE